jgi:hypothetical protein
VKPQRLQEHEALVRAVFEALAELRPSGFRYQAVKLADGLSFMHLASIDAGAVHPLRSLEAFKRFQEGIAERCSVQPASEDVERIGSYP